MNFDSFYMQGSTHQVCQDYAYHGLDYAVLADGCSSVKNTDIGARLLCHYFRECDTTAEAFVYAKANAIALGLNENCISATFGYIQDDYNNVRVELWGDGVVVAIDKNNDINIFHIDYKNFPYYPYYETDILANLRYKELHISKTVAHFYKNSLKFEECTPSSESLYFDKSVYKQVYLCSDGLLTFGKDIISIVEEFIPKNLVGEFIQRRCKKITKNMKPEDDFSMIGVTVD